MRSENDPDGQHSSFIEEARRRQIIAAAVAVIAELGYANATLARIAQRAGISKGVISYHFRGKEDLMTQLVIQLYVAGAEFMGPRLAAVVGPRERLAAYLATNLEFIAENRTYIAATSQAVLNLRERDGSLKFAAGDSEREMIAPLIDLLREGQRGGEFGEFDPTLMARSVRDVVDGVAGRAVREPDFDVAQYIAHVCRLFDVATRKAADDE